MTFSPVQQASIGAIWAGVADKYAPFNINVTTVDPAPAGYSDAERQVYYDSTVQLMHTVIGGNGSWASAGLYGGLSTVGAMASAVRRPAHGFCLLRPRRSHGPVDFRYGGP